MDRKRREEFRTNRTSWKWFQNRFDKEYDIDDRMKTLPSFQTRLFMEILKELQYLNDKKK